MRDHAAVSGLARATSLGISRIADPGKSVLPAHRQEEKFWEARAIRASADPWTHDLLVDLIGCAFDPPT